VPSAVAERNSLRPFAPPFVAKLEVAGLRRAGVRHWAGGIWFAVNDSREERNRPTRHEFLHEDDAAPPSLGRAVPDIKPQVDLFKIAMERKRNSENPGLEKEKPDHADIGNGAERIDLQAVRKERREQLRLDRVIQHDKVPPFRGQKNLAHAV
jgi:hypothetical protein